MEEQEAKRKLDRSWVPSAGYWETRVGIEPTERKAKKHCASGALKLRGRLRPCCNNRLAGDCGIIHVTNLLIK